MSTHSDENRGGKRSIAPEAIAGCIAVLETILSDRLLLGELSPDQRRKLLMAAGRVSRPERLEVMKLAKKHRVVKRAKERELDRKTRASSAIRVARESTIFIPPPQLGHDQRKSFPERELKQPRQCYICKISFSKLHFFYDSMCEPCGDFNYSKRFQTAPLEGRVALITGARLKIGFQSALMMLRAGARVVVSTRFARDAAERFSREPDFEKWGHRLQIFGLDLRHSVSVELFTRFLNQHLDRLDIIINNAAQTVRRPPGFYSHLMEPETQPYHELPSALQPLLRDYETLKTTLAGESAIGPYKSDALTTRRASPGVGLESPALLSQIAWREEEAAYDTEVFPVGKTDADLQQVDLRKMNSWRLKAW